MDAIDLFATLVAQRGRVRSIEYSSFPAYGDLIEAGLFAETGVVSSIVCDECDQPHDAKIVFESSQYGYYCPDLGFTPKARAELIAVQANLCAVVAQLADHLHCKRRKLSPLKYDTWRIGTIDTPAGDVVLYLKPTMQDAQDVHDFESALAGEVRSSYGVALTSSGTLRLSPYTTVPLQEVLSIEAGKLTVIADLATIAGVPVIRTGGRPNDYACALRQLSAVREREGHTLRGRNEEAKALKLAFEDKFPDRNSPSLPTVKRYVSEIRSGSKLDQN